MRRSTRTWRLAALAVLPLGLGCAKKDPAAGPRDAGGSILLTHPDGAPLIAPAITDPTPPVVGSGELRRCRVALRRPDWGPGGGMGSMQFKLRTFRGRGTRAEVLKLARESICREDGIPPDRCTDELFLSDYEWCDGDPTPERHPSPEIQEMADRIRAGAVGDQPVPIGLPPPADAGAAEPSSDAPPPGAAEPPVIF